MNKKDLAIGLLAGIAIGTLLGVLFAPEKGSETRAKISKAGDDIADDIKHKLDELLNNLAQKTQTTPEDLTKK